MKTINIKALSINQAFKGKRYKTKQYDNWRLSVLYLLPKMKVPNEKPLKLVVVFGFSSAASDLDNGLKTFIDALQLKYNFDDKYIFQIMAKKELVKRGKEFISFALVEIPLNKLT